MLDVEQAGNWSDRAYNKSGYLKYIRPNMEEVYGCLLYTSLYAIDGDGNLKSLVGVGGDGIKIKGCLLYTSRCV